MEKASEFLVEFIARHYSEAMLSSFLPFSEDSLFDLQEDLAQRFEYPLANAQEEGKTIDEVLLADATKAGDELREGKLDPDDFSRRVMSMLPQKEEMRIWFAS